MSILYPSEIPVNIPEKAIAHESCRILIACKYMVLSNVTVGEKSSLNGDSNQMPQADCARVLTTELLRPDKLTASHTPVIPMTL